MSAIARTTRRTACFNPRPRGRAIGGRLLLHRGQWRFNPRPRGRAMPELQAARLAACVSIRARVGGRCSAASHPPMPAKFQSAPAWAGDGSIGFPLRAASRFQSAPAWAGDAQNKTDNAAEAVSIRARVGGRCTFAGKSATFLNVSIRARVGGRWCGGSFRRACGSFQSAPAWAGDRPCCRGRSGVPSFNPRPRGRAMP